MKKYCLAAVSALCLLMVAQATGFCKDKIDYDKWITFYYKDPKPEHVVGALRYYQDTGTLKNDNFRKPCAVLFGRILSENQDKINDWMKELEDVRQKDRSVINYVLWYSSNAVSDALLRRYADKEEYTVWFSSPPPDVCSLEVGQRDVLDMNWSYFFVTGDEKPIINIMSAFKYTDYEVYAKTFRYSAKSDEDKRRAFLGSISLAAKWSLVSNGKQHPRVKEIIEAQAAISSGQRKQILETIIHDINENKYSQ